MSLVLLITGVAAAVATLFAVVRVRHPAAISVIVMLLGWLAGELAVLHLVLQVVVTVVLVSLGALDGTLGWIGLVAMVASWVGLIRVQHVAHRARPALADSLASWSPDAAERVRVGRPDRATLLRPFSFDRTGIDVVRDIAYGPDPKQRLDVYRPAAPGEGRPVMVYVHGGGWVSGKKEQQGLPLMHELVRAGWVCVAPDYRLAPQHRYPAQHDDVRATLHWVHDRVAEHGGDPSFVVVSGGSAGGHLAALASLDPESADLVSACVPIYGAFDFTDHLDIRGSARMRPFLERMVMPMKQRDDEEYWRSASPIHRIGAAAPPFLVIAGRLDVFVWREEAEAFVERLAERSASPVVYAEVRGAQHAFDLFHSVRCAATVDAIVAFCESLRHVRDCG